MQCRTHCGESLFFRTMPFSSCADQARHQAVPLIGTAPLIQCFVMIECPPPWGKTIQQAKYLPPALQTMVADANYRQRGIRFFLINDGRRKGASDRSTHDATEFPWQRVLIFERTQRFAAGYQAQELWVPTLEEGAIALQQYFSGEELTYPTQDIPTRDIFICTHGQRDRCCGCYGYPFYREAQRLSQQWSIPNLRFWQISHIGGHRFAPTLIDLPQGRYYGQMDEDSLKLLVLQQGDWRSLLEHYRGWSLLPAPLQQLERLFWRNQGWQWLTQHIHYEVLRVSENQQRWQAQFAHGDPYGFTQEWWVDIVENVSQRIQSMGSCSDETPSLSKTYQISTLQAIGELERIVA